MSYSAGIDVKIFNFFIAVTISILVSGCAGVPPLITYLGYAKTAGDVGSWIKTEKTLTDHALSAVTKEDCALFRIVKNEKVCRDKEEEVAAKIKEIKAEEAKKEYVDIWYTRKTNPI